MGNLGIAETPPSRCDAQRPQLRVKTRGRFREPSREQHSNHIREQRPWDSSHSCENCRTTGPRHPRTQLRVATRGRFRERGHG